MLLQIRQLTLHTPFTANVASHDVIIAAVAALLDEFSWGLTKLTEHKPQKSPLTKLKTCGLQRPTYSPSRQMSLASVRH